MESTLQSIGAVSNKEFFCKLVLYADGDDDDCHYYLGTLVPISLELCFM